MTDLNETLDEIFGPRASSLNTDPSNPPVLVSLLHIMGQDCISVWSSNGESNPVVLPDPGAVIRSMEQAYKERGYSLRTTKSVREGTWFGVNKFYLMDPSFSVDSLY